MDRERNILFGVFALQLKHLTAAQLVDIFELWKEDPVSDLPDRLIGSGLITEEDSDSVRGAVESAISSHDGDPAKTLSLLGGEEQFRTSLRDASAASAQEDDAPAQGPRGLEITHAASASDEKVESAGGPDSSLEETLVPTAMPDPTLGETLVPTAKADDTIESPDPSSETVVLDDASTEGPRDREFATETKPAANEPDKTVIASGLPNQTVIASGLPDQTVVSSDPQATIPASSDPMANMQTKITSTGGAIGDASIGLRVEESPGRYTRETEHARGGMGRILLVHDEFIGRDVALKELLPELAGVTSPGFGTSTPAQPMLMRFIEEARLTGQLEHPSIVPVYELGQREDGSFYYTMKLLRGKDLADVIHNARSLQERLDLLPHFVDMCQAIAFAHSKGVIHRDLKPDNVMVGEFGETVVIDWGLAKRKRKRELHAVEDKEDVDFSSSGPADMSKTAYGQALGTPAYMPPEQARGELDKIDERSDVYSLGAVLYELLTAQLPISGTTLEEALQNVIEKMPTPVREIEPDVPPELEAIAMRAMSKAPKDRYRSAKELAEEVRRFQSGALVQSYQYKTSEVIAKWVKQHKAVVTTAAVAAMLIIGLTVGFVLSLLERNEKIQTANSELETNYAKLEDSNVEIQKLNVQEIERRQMMAQQAYQGAIQLAVNHISSEKPSAARIALERAPAQWRNWEWGYLYGILDPSKATLTGHLDAVLDVTFSPNGARILSASTDHTARVWDVKTGAEVLALHGHIAPVNACVFSSDGTRILTASDDRTAIIWSAATGEELLVLEGHTNRVRGANFNRDASRVVTASYDGTARIWDAATGEELLVIAGVQGELPIPVHDAAFSPDGASVVLGMGDGKVKLWNAATAELIRTFEERGHRDAVLEVSFSPDGQQILTASADATAKLWDLAAGPPRWTLDGHDDTVFSARFSKDGTQIVTASNDKRTKVWDVKYGDQLRTFSGHEERVFGAAFSPDGTQIATASFDKTIKFWDAQDDSRLVSIKGHEGFVNKLVFSPDGKTFATASYDGTGKIWNAETLEEIHRLDGHDDALFGICFSSDGKRILTASQDKTVRIWDTQTGNALLILSGHQDGLFDVAINADGSRVITASWTEAPRLWDGQTGKQIRELGAHSGPIIDISFSTDGKMVATASIDQTAMSWDAETGKLVRKYGGATAGGHTAPVRCVRFHPNGKRILTASEDGTAKLWDVNSGVMRITLSGHTDAILYAEFNHDGSRIVTASSDSTAIIWDSEEGQILSRLTGHAGAVKQAFFNADGTRVITVSSDNTAKVWNTEGGDEPRTLVGLGRGLNAGAFGPLGRRIATAYADGTVLMWAAIPWNDTDWDNEDDRRLIVKIDEKVPPQVLRHDFRIDRGFVYGQLRQLAAFIEDEQTGASPAQEASDEAIEAPGKQEDREADGLPAPGASASPAIIESEGGLIVSNPDAFQFFPQLALQKGDVLYRIGGRDIHTRDQAKTAIGEALRSLEANASKPYWLEFGTHNYLSRRSVTLHFPGIVRSEISLKRAVAEAVFDISIHASESEVERALRNILSPVGLQSGDRIIEFAGHEITEFDSWNKAYVEAKRMLEDQNPQNQIKLLAERPRSDQLIVITLRIEDPL